MACTDCNGTGEGNVTPLECPSNQLACNNPCGVGPGNTAACESLPSQIENFTIQFFGEVVKTEVNGVVTWTLPCSLDVGLPANPRGIDEGLACYFLRLFQDGIIGLTGPQGEAGAAGADGHNAYSVTMASFTQPSPGSPLVSVVTAYNPAMVDGLYVFIDGSGWYQILSTDGSGVLYLSLFKAIASPPTTVPAGKLVVPSGVPGASVTGPTGPPGPTGPQGPAGANPTATHGQYNDPAGTNFDLPLTYTAVDFTSSAPQFTFVTAGVYLVTVVASIIANAGFASSDAVTLKLRNTSTNADIPGSIQKILDMNVGQIGQIVINVLVTTDAAGQSVHLFGECSTASKATVIADNTTMTYVRVQ